MYRFRYRKWVYRLHAAVAIQRTNHYGAENQFVEQESEDWA